MSNKNNFYLLLGNVGQWLSVFIMGYGIYLLIHCGLDYGTILFSLGCLIQTLSTKLKYYGDEYIKRNKDILRITYEKHRFVTKHRKNIVVDDTGANQYF